LVFLVRDEGLEQAQKTIMDEMSRVLDWMPGLPVAAEIGPRQALSGNQTMMSAD
jgi:hypothetical protein